MEKADDKTQQKPETPRTKKPAKPIPVIPVEIEQKPEKPERHVKPVDAKPVEVKPAEVKPVEIKPVEVKDKEVIPEATADVKPKVTQVNFQEIYFMKQNIIYCLNIDFSKIPPLPFF